jgi:SAM-dependent methyltransferase
VETRAVRSRQGRLFRSGHAYQDIEALLSDKGPKGLCLDFPSGKGVNIQGIRNAGFYPIAADLYPGQVSEKGVSWVKATFTRPIPFKAESFAAVLCSEGIEHCATQLQLLYEFARVLKPGGTLIVTTPNTLNFRARLSYLLNGHYTFARLPLTEATQLRSEPGEREPHVGHVFLTMYFALRFMLKLAGFEKIEVATAKYSPSSLFMAPFLFVPVWIATRRLLRRALAKHHPDICSEVLAHTLSADMLFGKKLILVAKKPDMGGKDQG